MVINYATREIDFKIVYYGAGLSGKTTNLEWIHRCCRPEQRGNLVSLETSTERTLFFDFLPIDLGTLNGFSTRFRLYTVPGQIHYNASRKLILNGLDGICFVADSQQARIEANLESYENLRDNLAEHGYNLDRLPHVIQYNKRDMPDAMAIEDLDAVLNDACAPYFEAEAVHGVGVFETLRALGRSIILMHRAASDAAMNRVA